MRRFHPADCLLLGLLLLAVVLALLSPRPAGTLYTLPFAALFGILFALAFSASQSETALYNRLRPVATVGIVFFLYSMLGRFGLERAFSTFDLRLAKIDASLFGFDPSQLIQELVSPRALDWLAFCYAYFIPYIHLSLFLNLEARSGDNQREFLTAWTLLYTLSYLGYLLIPAMGPAMFPELHHHRPLPHTRFVDLTVNGVEATGGYFGAFPSLHVGASVFLCRGDTDRDRLRSLIYLPIVLGIYAATIALRYHYVIDLIVGTALALLCRPLGRALSRHWRAR